jgi:FkbM family methyltransferase
LISNTQKQSIFDRVHYRQHIEARGETIRRVTNDLKGALGLSTAIDVGCGLGFFSQILQECGLSVRAIDGRLANIEEARLRYPKILFDKGDIQDQNIPSLGTFDLVLCFGLLYHLESPLLAIRNLRSLTRKGLLLESMCLPGIKPLMQLREELSLEDQSLTDVAFYPTETCLVKMLYRAGFTGVYRVRVLPDHDDFRDTREHCRRRTVLFASVEKLTSPSLIAVDEPTDHDDPWSKLTTHVTPSMLSRAERLRRFIARPTSEKIRSVTARVHRIFPKAPVLFRLPFGAWFLAGNSHVDAALLTSEFESAEVNFVQKYLKPGMIALDIGAHHGLYTLLASKKVGPGGKVVAFEPSPRERKQLSRNVRLNSCRNVRIQPIALGSKRSQTDLYLVEGGEDGCNSLRPPVVDSETRRVRVDVYPFDEVAPQLGLTRVDFVKLDVEGAELDVLKGAPGLLRSPSRPVLLVEVYDIRTQPWGYKAREIVGFLDQLGYRWFELVGDGSIRPVAPTQQAYDANLVAVPVERQEEVCGWA